MSDIPPPVLSIEELQEQLAASQDEVRKLRDAVNRWQGFGISALRNIQSALGSLLKITNEVREYLQEGTLPEDGQ